MQWFQRFRWNVHSRSSCDLNRTEEGAELIGSFHTRWLTLARRYGLSMISRMDEDLYQRAGLDVNLRLDAAVRPSEICKLGDDMRTVLAKIARDAATSD